MLPMDQQQGEVPTEELTNNFGTVIKFLKESPTGWAWRKGWNGKGQWIALQVPDEHSKMGLPYIYICTVDGKLVPWCASQTDILAEDWLIA